MASEKRWAQSLTAAGIVLGAVTLSGTTGAQVRPSVAAAKSESGPVATISRTVSVSAATIELVAGDAASSVAVPKIGPGAVAIPTAAAATQRSSIAAPASASPATTMASAASPNVAVNTTTTTTTTSTTTTTTLPLGRPPGLIQAGDSKSTCIDATPGSTLAPAEMATGITYNCLVTFTNVDPAWSDWVNPWITHPQYGYSEWIAADPTHRTIIVTQNLIPTAVSDNSDPATWEVPCDAGAYNGYATQFAQSLVATGFEYIVIRLGAEPSGTWEDDFVGTTAAEQADWGACFAQEVSAMRAVPGAHFLFDWNVNSCYEDIPFANYYPGNAYVDIMGIDQYDASCRTTLPGPTAASWNELSSEPNGLEVFQAFAASHDKPMSIPEWGLQATPNGDDPIYVDGIGSFVHNNDVAFESYFDPGDDNILMMNSAVPLSLAAYKQQFGS